MRTSQYLISTLKETPSDAEMISHKLMLRAGMIRKLSSGLYTWMPTGIRVLKKIENIIRKEMNNIGALEVSMPIVQPASLWKKSNRWEQYGPELLRVIDRSNRVFVLGPTHEEVITNIIRNEIKSYKQLPLNLFQIQTKFRDEVRPRCGVMRTREFLMKDAYSFHTSKSSLQETYDKMLATYIKIFSRINLDFRVVKADTGTIGGHTSHEFQVIANSGEDTIIFSNESDYAANIEMAEALAPKGKRPPPTEELRIVNTPDVKNIEELIKKFNIPIEKIVKTILVHANKDSGHKLVALLIRGDHEITEIKATKLKIVANPLKFATESEIYTEVNTSLGSLGPINIKVPIIVDHTVAMMSDFIAGANIDGKHYFGINWGRDLLLPLVSDLRKVVKGDPSPDGKGNILVKRSIEIGHIFQLGTQYTKTFKATIQDKNGIKQIINMGCYGIGITRLVAATIEQNHDERGIIWPNAIAPFQVAILPINMHKDIQVKSITTLIYNSLNSQGIEVILDDRKESIGVMFADMELIGIPHMIIISHRNLDNNIIEYSDRRIGNRQVIKVSEIEKFLISKIKC
ncbi:proline--tRNA ligase [Candidatus Profftia sp. (ex Adelges kitamiensis)]|uniref:proline--tRNA ligase n=1 Tax=Candidatus Profftia sp. (ex Adelges kitamiensis) TaxID=2864218 RepID=UPI001CE24F64|nr:proline--tRNA ligase [Candidatus Profftia sp. (ex Adelges kitamiensis)]